VSYWPRGILFVNFITAISPLLTLRLRAGGKRRRDQGERETLCDQGLSNDQTEVVALLGCDEE